MPVTARMALSFTRRAPEGWVPTRYAPESSRAVALLRAFEAAESTQAELDAQACVTAVTDSVTVYDRVYVRPWLKAVLFAVEEDATETSTVLAFARTEADRLDAVLALGGLPALASLLASQVADCPPMPTPRVRVVPRGDIPEGFIDTGDAPDGYRANNLKRAIAKALCPQSTVDALTLATEARLYAVPWFDHLLTAYGHAVPTLTLALRVARHHHARLSEVDALAGAHAVVVLLSTSALDGLLSP